MSLLLFLLHEVVLYPVFCFLPLFRFPCTFLFSQFIFPFPSISIPPSFSLSSLSLGLPLVALPSPRAGVCRRWKCTPSSFRSRVPPPASLCLHRQFPSNSVVAGLSVDSTESSLISIAVPRQTELLVVWLYFGCGFVGSLVVCMLEF